MSQPGGPAALNGFLYQMLHHLHWMAEVRLAGALNGRRVTNATLVLEPSGGGDGVGEARETHLVEQYKTRHARTWSLADLMPVLADLRKAVPPSLPQNASYRFVTDGRSGRLAAFQSFLRAARSAHTPDDLDDLTKREFRQGFAVTDRVFLAHVDAATRLQSPSDGEAPAARRSPCGHTPFPLPLRNGVWSHGRRNRRCARRPPHLHRAPHTFPPPTSRQPAPWHASRETRNRRASA